MNRLLRGYLLFNIAVILSGCADKDDTIKNLTHKFEFIVNDNYIKENERIWVLVYSDRNTLVSEKELVNNSQVELTWEAEENDSLYTVQLISASIDDNDESYEIFAYTQVYPNTWKLNGSQVSEKPAAIGSNNIDISNINMAHYYPRITNLGHGYGYLLNNIYTLTQHYNPDIIWVCFYNDNEASYYCLLDSVSLNEDIVLSANDLVPMENYIDYDFPMASYSDVYLHADHVFENNINPYFLVTNLFNYKSSNSMRVYYPGNLFSSYIFSLSFRVDNVFETMINKGPTPPAEIVRMDITEEINSNSVQNFECVISGEAEYADHIWEYCIYDNQNGDKIFRYHVYSPVSETFNYHAPEIPVYYSDLNSDIVEISNLELSETRFFQVDNSKEYEDFITKTYINPEQANNYNLKLAKVVNY
jgi:hypothetical protein